MSARLTPDITIRGRMPTKLEYTLHLQLLRDVLADQVNRGNSNRVYSNWLSKDMSDVQHEVWIAAHQAGLIKQDREHFHRLTPYGIVYLEQRT